MLYVSSACIKKRVISEIIQELVKYNIKNIELSGGTDCYDNLEDDLLRLKKQYDLNYACHAYFPPAQVPFVVNLAACNDQIYQRSINHYVQCIEMLKRLDCKVLSIHAGFLVEIGSDEIGKKLKSRIVYDADKAYDRFCTAYDYIAKLCAKNDISLYLENNVLSADNYGEFDYHNYMMMTDYSSIMEMRKQINFNLLLDLGHLYVSATTLGLDYAQECNKLSKYIKWVHISENNGVIDEHKPLISSGKIMEEFCKIYNSDLDVTLETVGSTEEILRSLELIKTK